MFKKMLSMALAAIMVMGMGTTALASETNSDDQINVLLERRAELICLEKYEALESIDQQLSALGVEKLTPQEVKERFYTDSKGRVSTPASSNVTWLSSRTEYPYNGVTYEVQTLIAQPNQNNSNLKMSGSKAISSTYKWKAGSMNALSAVGSALVGEIPGASIALTVYDTVNGFVTGISKTTEISAAEIVYSYSHTTTASFKYVKVKGQSDNNQSLTFISTNGTTAIGYQYPSFSYSGGTVKPNVVQGKRTLTSTPSGYNSNYNAVKAYTDMYAAKRASVGSVTITGLETKSVAKIYPVCPEFPAHIN